MFYEKSFLYERHIALSPPRVPSTRSRLLSQCFPFDSPGAVAVCLASISLHHGPQCLPLPLHRAAALGGAVGPPPPVASALLPLRLHGDWLTILIHKVHLLPVMVMRMLSRFGLISGETRQIRERPYVEQKDGIK